MNPIPTPKPDLQEVSDFSYKTKCFTCAYHTPSTEEEDQMTIAYWMEKPVPHRCHERRKNIACVGATEACVRLGLMEKR